MSTTQTTPLTAKQLEIRHREERILDTVTPLLRDDGIAAISIDSIARAMKLTRGTIYNHFPNKEEILLALATRAVRRRMELFHFATTLAESPRDRCAAIGIAAEVYVDCMPDDFVLEQSIRHDSVWHKTSEGRRRVLAECEVACISAVGELIEQAIQCGDLVLPLGDSKTELIQQITFGLWSLVYGGLVLEYSSPSLTESGIRRPRETIRRNCNALLDQMNWAPLYQPSQYSTFVLRITPAIWAQAEAMLSGSSLPMESKS